MKMKSVVLLVVAIGCGLVAMLGVQQVLSGGKDNEADTTKVLVAIADIVPGTPLDKPNTIFKEMPKKLVPDGAVTDPKQVADKSLMSRAVINEIIMQAKLGHDTGASNEIPKGMRVVTTSVNLTKTHSGLIRAGDRVDILLSYKQRSSEGPMISKTRTILEFIEVFATDNVLANQDLGDTTEIDAKNLSFLVTPEQAAILMWADTKGDLNLALRHKHDDEQVVGTVIDDSVVLGDAVRALFGEDYNNDEDGEPTLVEETVVSAEPVTPEEVVEPEVPQWEIVIYSGEKVIKQLVSLPLDENGMTEDEAAFAKRQAELDAREASIQAREAVLEGNISSGDGSTPITDETQPASTEKSDQPAKTDTENADPWKGVFKRFLLGA